MGLIQKGGTVAVIGSFAVSQECDENLLGKGTKKESHG